VAEPRPTFVATEEGADAVVGAARRRRARQVVGLTSVSAFVAAGLAGTLLLYPRTDGTDRLQATQGPRDKQTVSTASPSISRTPAGVPDQSPTAAPPAVGPSVGPSTSPLTVPPGTAGPHPTAPPPSTHWSSPRRVSPIHRTKGSISSTDVCNDDPSDATSGWCVRYLGPTAAHRGHPTTVSAELCRLNAFGSATLTFTSTREIALEVDGPGSNSTTHKDWQAGEGVRYRSRGTAVTVAGGRCLVWSSTWDTRDEQGFVVPPAGYQVYFTIQTTGPSFSGSGSIDVTD
jgi:hypothetical protein